MRFLSLPLKGLAVAAIIWILLAGLWTARPFLNAREAICSSCGGDGYDRGLRTECDACEGTGGRYALGRFLDRYGHNLLQGRRALFGWVGSRPGELLIDCTLVLLVGLLAWAARIVECPFCRGVGRVTVVVEDLETEQFCAGCGGSGQGTELDRWAIRLAKEG